MKIFKFYMPLFFLVISALASCQTIKGTEFSGNFKGSENMSIFLEQITLEGQQGTTSLVTEKVDGQGNFKISLPDGVQKGVYRLRVGEQALDLVTDGSEKKIEVSGQLAELNNFKYTVKGSKLSEEFLKTVTDYIATQDVPKLKEYTMKTADPLIGFQIAARLFQFRLEAADVHKAVSDRLNTTYPDLALSKGYANIVSQIDQQMKMQQAASTIQVGQPAPEIALPGPDGKVRKLSDYKGKVVLIDFWASWCGPCRKANPHVVEVYNKYKSRGFDVFSVSLDGLDSRTAAKYSADEAKQVMDGSKERWVSAIQQDGLIWDGHVSDLKKWESAPAGEYGVRSIPQTFLVGKDGKIVAINPRTDLEQQVSNNL
jgi:thiol-disulfide isomerase/thioredoxin